MGEAMAAVRVICPWCQAPLRADSSQAGSTIPCPKCQSEVVVPAGVAPVRPQAIQPTPVAPISPIQPQPAAPAQGFSLPAAPATGTPYAPPQPQGVPYSGHPQPGYPQSGMHPQGQVYPQGQGYPQAPSYPSSGVYPQAASFPQGGGSGGFSPLPGPAASASGLPDFGAAASGGYPSMPGPAASASGLPDFGFGSPMSGGMPSGGMSGGLPPMGGMGLDPLGGLPAMGLPGLPTSGAAAGPKPAAPGSDAFANLPYVVGGSVLAALVVAMLIVVPFLMSRKGPPKPAPEVAAASTAEPKVVATSTSTSAPAVPPTWIRDARTSGRTHTYYPPSSRDWWGNPPRPPTREAPPDLESFSTVSSIGIVALGTGVLVVLAGWLMVLMAAFNDNVLWGLIILLFPIAGLIFILTHWEETKSAFLTYIGGLGLVFVGAILMKVGMGP